MANSIKIGNSDITLKLGSSDVTAAYLGDTLVYSGGTTPPTPTLQWVTFNDGDDMYNLEIYGIKGTVSDLRQTFNSYGGDITFDGPSCGFVPIVTHCFEIGGGCYTAEVSDSDNIEVIFSNVGCSDYYISPVSRARSTIQLYIYA